MSTPTLGVSACELQPQTKQSAISQSNLASRLTVMASLSSLFLGAGFLVAAAAFYFRSYNIGGDATTTTQLHFFMHDDYTGPRPTAMRVVAGRSLIPAGRPDDGDGGNDDAVATGSSTTSSSLLSSSPRQFGDIVVLNNALTEGPARDSTRVGTAQGFAVRVSEGGIVSDLTLHLVLDAGEHRGSSVTVSGRIDMDATARESMSSAARASSGWRAGTCSPGTTTTASPAAASSRSTSTCSTSGRIN